MQDVRNLHSNAVFAMRDACARVNLSAKARTLYTAVLKFEPSASRNVERYLKEGNPSSSAIAKEKQQSPKDEENWDKIVAAYTQEQKTKPKGEGEGKDEDEDDPFDEARGRLRAIGNMIERNLYATAEAIKRDFRQFGRDFDRATSSPKLDYKRLAEMSERQREHYGEYARQASIVRSVQAFAEARFGPVLHGLPDPRGQISALGTRAAGRASVLVPSFPAYSPTLTMSLFADWPADGPARQAFAEHFSHTGAESGGGTDPHRDPQLPQLRSQLLCS